MVDEIVTRQELIDAKRDARDLGKAVNEKVIVSPRYGEDFKSLPMITDEAQAMIGEWGSAITLITQDGGVPALAVSDSSGKTQQEINDNQAVLNTGLESIAEMLAIQNPINGMRVYVKSYQTGLNTGGGAFVFDSTRVTINDGGIVINGWVRQYSGGVYVEWFGADNTGNTDTSLFLEKCLAVSNTANFGDGDFLFSSECGIPDTSTNGYPNTSKYQTEIIGCGDTRFNIANNERPIFTSARSKGVNFNSNDDLFSAKINFRGITMFGGVANAVAFNADRLYNVFVTNCNFYQLYALATATVVRGEEPYPYSQSLTFHDNHCALNKNLIIAPVLYNFRFTENMCEANDNGIILNTTPLQGPRGSIMGATITDNLFEGGGIFLDCVHPISLVCNSNYFEGNKKKSAVDAQCGIRVNGLAQGTSFCNNFFMHNESSPEYVEILYTNHYLRSGSYATPSSGFINLIGNNGGFVLHNPDGAFISIGNSLSENSRNKSLAMFSPMQAALHYAYSLKPQNTADIRDAVKSELRVGVLDLSRLESAELAQQGLTINLDLRLVFGDNSNTPVGQFIATALVSIYASSYNPNVINASAKLLHFIDNDELDSLTTSGEKYAQNFGDTVQLKLERVNNTMFNIILTEYWFSRNPPYVNTAIDYKVSSITARSDLWAGGLVGVMF